MGVRWERGDRIVFIEVVGYVMFVEECLLLFVGGKGIINDFFLFFIDLWINWEWDMGVR